MKYLSLIFVFLLFSCGKKEDVLLPKANVSVVKDVKDHSPIYIFFRTEGKDTLAEVNRKNSIISTNWLFNIDKRLPLKTVIPEVMKLQEKKRADSAHKNEEAQNYYTYADTIGKNMAFLPFTDVYYKLGEVSKDVSQLYFKKNGRIEYKGKKTYDFPKENLVPFLDSLIINPKAQITFSYDKNMTYGEYVRCKILINKLVIKEPWLVFINYNEDIIY
ncbi:hypothetical protein LNQ49_21200 [Flavobacterium sp. F-65]|jgi:hypothetical protein|uniref:Lipoprotein n=1 Tax=Flavobacterium pisciphilum TaxID=2893755 RepID=A0ABS8MZA0_9FLAO|nr:hypothetical protein [Flavobacterium sp. F-65]MCC9074109.1 hypothetical protein [Flavobacterium sp. F-65]